MDLNKIVFSLNEFNEIKEIFSEYFNSEEKYLFPNCEKYYNALCNINYNFNQKKYYLSFFDEYDLRAICDIVIYFYYKKIKEDPQNIYLSFFFAHKVIHRMQYLTGYESTYLKLIPEKLIAGGKIINNFYSMSMELLNDYSLEITKPQLNSIFALKPYERVIIEFKYEYKNIFYENSSNFTFVEKFLNLDSKKKEEIKIELDLVFEENCQIILFMGERLDFTKAKLFREVGIDKIKAKLKLLLKSTK